MRREDTNMAAADVRPVSVRGTVALGRRQDQPHRLHRGGLNGQDVVEAQQRAMVQRLDRAF